MRDLSVINECLLNSSKGEKITLTNEQLGCTGMALEIEKGIWEVETGLGKTYMAIGYLNSLMPQIVGSGKKAILVAPTNKVLEFVEMLREHTAFEIGYSSGQVKEVQTLIACWNKINVAVVTPSIWGSSLEFNCHVYNHRKEILVCIWDEADRVKDTGFLTFIELCRRYPTHIALLNATPLGKSVTSDYIDAKVDDSLRVLYNLLRGIAQYTGTYSSFFGQYTNSKTSGGQRVVLVDFDKLLNDFGTSIIKYNREDIQAEVCFSDINFHRCTSSDIQKQYLAKGYPLRQVLYSPETSNAFALNPRNVPALGSLTAALMRLPVETNKIVFMSYTKSIECVKEFLTTLGYKVYIYDGKHTPTAESKMKVEKLFNTSQGAIVLTNVEKAGNLGSASNVIIYDSPADVIQYIARAVRGFTRKYLTLDWVYYPDHEYTSMVDLADATINNTIQNNRDYDLIYPLLNELSAVKRKAGKLKAISETYENYRISRLNN